MVERKKYSEMTLGELRDRALWFSDKLAYLEFLISKRITAGEK